MVTRLQHRGVLGVLADGRIRDVQSCREISRNTNFTIWSKGLSAAGPSMEAKPWAVNVSIHVAGVWAHPGDVICIDEEDEVAVVIPQQQLRPLFELLPVLKAASNGVLELVRSGKSLPEAVKQNPDFYSNYGSASK